MVLSWIIRTLTPQIAESVVYIDDAKIFWEDLKERFSKDDYFRISDLLQEIHSIKQGDNKNNILRNKMVEEIIGVDKVKGEAEEDSIVKENNAHIVIKLIIH